MIPGSISKITESVVNTASTITVKTDVVHLNGPGTILTINPGMGTEQGQLLMLTCNSAVILGVGGNISTGLREGATFRFLPVQLSLYKTTMMIYSKFYKYWIVVAGAGETAAGAVNLWKFEEASGNIAYDSAGPGHGTISGGVTQNFPGAIPFSKAYGFDGITGKILVDVPLPPIGASMTVWVKTSSAAQQPIFSTRRMEGEATNSHVYLGTNAGKILVSTDLSISSGIGLVNDGEWHHIALVFFGATCVMYIDGKYDATVFVAGRGSIGPKGSIAWDGKNNEFWQGALDELAIWPFALDSPTVNKLYEAGTGAL